MKRRSKRGRTWNQIGSAVAAKLLRAIDVLPANELRALRTFTRRATGTNCAWFAYAVRDFMSARADEVLKHRRRLKRELVKEAARAVAGPATRR